MALSNTIAKIEDVAEAYRVHYSDVDGILTLDKNLQTENIDNLLSAKQHEKEAKDKALKEAKKLQAEKDAWNIEKAELQGDKEKADKLRQDAIDRVKSETDKDYKEKIESRDKRIHDLTIGRLQDDIASEVYIKPSAMNLSFISDRIKLNDKDESYIVDSLGATMNKADFIKELKSDESMSMFIKAGDGSGGGTKQNASSSDGGLSPMQKKIEHLKAIDKTLE